MLSNDQCHLKTSLLSCQALKSLTLYFSQNSYYALSLEKGYLVLNYQIDGQKQEPVKHPQKITFKVRALVL